MINRTSFVDFVAWWRQYCKGDEKGEAQVFLDRLFKALGYDGALEAGGSFETRVYRKHDGKSAVAFADFLIPKTVLVEMKKRGEDLRKHYDQARNYWMDLAGERPRYVILCNFDELWIYDFNTQVYDPVDMLRIEELEETGRAQALSFLFPTPITPIFRNNKVQVTCEAADRLADVFLSLTGRGIERKVAQRFVLQCLVALFSEDIGLLPSATFTRILEEAQSDKMVAAVSHDVITLLFFMMNSPGKKVAGRFFGVDYFNGGLFSKITPIALQRSEARLLYDAAHHHDWSKIQPAIFGRLFEHSATSKDRHGLGQHFTSEIDILRIVQPVITRPWQERIDAAQTVHDLLSLREGLLTYRVLDPACGSGNFLNIAYREMKRLESRLLDRLAGQGVTPDDGHFVQTDQFYGLDIDGFAVELAKVTLSITKKLVVDELGLAEDVLPLDRLDDHIFEGDALFVPWPAFDACIGNPPYLGAKRLKVDRGVSYVNQVRAQFPGVPGNADYCVYWFRKAHELMSEGARAGLVGTNTIRQNYSRIGGLDYITANDGHIFEAVSSLEWSGEANVHVSIACWSKGEPPFHPARLWLNGEQVVETPIINSALSLKTDVSGAQRLPCNMEPKRVFQGQTLGDDAFLLESAEAISILRRHPKYRDVLLPFLIGRDLLANPQSLPGRFVIDLNKLDLIDAQQYREVLKRIEKHVLPMREQKAKEEEARNLLALKVNPSAPVNHHYRQYLSQWWKHAFGRADMIEAIEQLNRYIVCSRVTKRPVFDFVSLQIRPDTALMVFAFEDDYTFGILQSSLHWAWFTEKASTLKSDFRYTPHSVFDTFPFPQFPSHAQVKAVADAARALHEWRRERMAKSESLNLRKLYQSLEQPGKNPLRDLHAALDATVYAAYGFDLQGDPLAQLLAVNQAVYERIQVGEAVTPPGVPPDYPNPLELVSAGCIQPPELI